LKKQNEKLQEEFKIFQKTAKQKLIEAVEEIQLQRNNNAKNQEAETLKEEVKLLKEQLDVKEKEINTLNDKLKVSKSQEEKYRRLSSEYKTNNGSSGTEDFVEELARHRTIVEKQKDLLNKMKNENKELKNSIEDQELHLNDVEASKGELQNKVREQDDMIKAYNKQIEALLDQLDESSNKEQDY